MQSVLLIPIYEPCPKALPFLKSIDPSSFSHIVIVDDGSGASFRHIFTEIAALPNFDVIGYEGNEGKGYALKCGIKHIAERYPETDSIVTADGDGQHLLADILRVRDESLSYPDALILGERDLSGPNVPKTSKFGNRWGSMYAFLETGAKIEDTQTGLRAIPKALFPLALSAAGERYEYEQNFLCDALMKAPVRKVRIATLYDEESKKGSHWRPAHDSWRLYRVFFTYLIIGLASFTLDMLIFSLLYYLSEAPDAKTLFLSCVTARLFSGALNFPLLSFITYKYRGDFGKNALLYLARFLINFGLSFGFLYLLKDASLPLWFWKIVGDSAIFCLNFALTKSILVLRRKRIQKRFRH